MGYPESCRGLAEEEGLLRGSPSLFISSRKARLAFLTLSGVLFKFLRNAVASSPERTMLAVSSICIPSLFLKLRQGFAPCMGEIQRLPYQYTITL